MKHFYLVCGLPGSGKSYFASSIPGARIICRDNIYKKLKETLSPTKASYKTSKHIAQVLKSLTDDIVVYDSVCANRSFREYILNQVPHTYIKHIIFFSPPTLTYGIENYVDWLQSIRKTYPEDREKTITIIQNMLSKFEPLNLIELADYECEIHESYYNSLQC